jgi:hypothetical protein
MLSHYVAPSFEIDIPYQFLVCKNSQLWILHKTLEEKHYFQLVSKLNLSHK